MVSCNSETKTRKQIEQLQNSGKAEKYQLGIAYMHYISQPGYKINYSKDLVKKLLSLGFFAESINAVETLLEKSPNDPELFYLYSVGYRNLLQYDLAVENLDHALSFQPGNKLYSEPYKSLKEERKIWSEIQTLNQSLINTTDTFPILLDRAEHLFSIRQYDAVLYDLGSLSKMGSASDSTYFASSVSTLYQEGGRKSVEILTDMMSYYRKVRDRKDNIK